MYLIDLVYKTVLAIANSDVRGNIKPSEIRLLINSTVEEIYESYFYEVNRMINRKNKGLVGSGIENIPTRISEKIRYYIIEKKIETTDQLPSDLRYIDSLFADSREVEILNSLPEFNKAKRISSKLYPIGYNNGSSRIQIYPLGYKEIMLSYLRSPKVPNWTYVVIRGAEVFNPSASDFQELDIHSSEVSNVIIKTLQKVGINLKEQDLAQVMQQQQNIEFNQEMTS